MSKAIVILGAAVWPNEKPSPTLLRRTLHAAALYDLAPCPIIACGGVGKNAPSEAEVMRRILMSEGVPEGTIYLEGQSNTTKENIKNAIRIVINQNITEFEIVTDLYHAPRARLTARRFSVKAMISSPSVSDANLGQQIKSSLREVPAFLYYAATLWP